jgi:allantoinase
MADFDLVLTGRVVGTHTILENGYVAIRDGKVERIGEGAPPQAAERQNFGSAFVVPGAIDAQVHSRSQKGQEDFIWSTRAAAIGADRYSRANAAE